MAVMKNYIKYLLAAVGFLVLILTSEVIYRVKNVPEFSQTVYRVLAKQTASLNNIKSSLNFLEKAAQVTIKINAKIFPEYNQESYSKINYDSRNQEFQKEYKNYITHISSLDSSQDKARHLAKIFYDLGLIAYKTGGKSMVVYFFQTAIFLDPYFSYYHVELANYYLAQGERSQAEKAIEFCLKFDVTIEHCNEYQNDNLQINYPEEVGFLKQRVELFVK